MCIDVCMSNTTASTVDQETGHAVHRMAVPVEIQQSLPPQEPLVLVIEDSDDARISLQQVLESSGYRTHGVADARAAMLVVERMRPRAAIIDLRLPGMSGRELIHWVRQAFGPGPALIVATGSTDPLEHEAARRAGADHIFVKPLDVMALRSVLPAVGATSVQGGALR